MEDFYSHSQSASADPDVFSCFTVYVIVITWAEDIMADNSPSPWAQPEDEDYFHHNIRDNAL